ncbi:MAG: TIGR00730 family Rossman fold protein [Bacteroidales bacterium]
MSKRLCVYCSSSNILEEKYIEAAREFAKAASLLSYTVVCGGSLRGLMGIIIDTMLSAGSSSRVEGVIPEFMGKMEIHHPMIKRLQIVDSMSKRKELLRKETDAVIAFPGGLGTLEEFLETLTLKRLGQYDGLVILFNQDGFYDSLLAMLEQFVQNRVLNSNYLDSLIVVDNVNDLIEAVKNGKRGLLNAAHYLPI